jgi:hypothetical protein
MPRRTIPEAELHARALQAARRMIAGGERPGYRLIAGPDGHWAVDGLPGISAVASSRHTASTTLRSRIASVLDVDPSTFDVDR